MKTDEHKTPTSTFRASQALLRKVNDYARAQGVSKSNAIRLLIEKGLGTK